MTNDFRWVWGILLTTALGCGGEATAEEPQAAEVSAELTAQPTEEVNALTADDTLTRRAPLFGFDETNPVSVAAAAAVGAWAAEGGLEGRVTGLAFDHGDDAASAGFASDTEVVGLRLARVDGTWRVVAEGAPHAWGDPWP